MKEAAVSAALEISPGFQIKPQDKTLFGSFTKLVQSCFIRKFPTERDILYALGKIDCKLYATIQTINARALVLIFVKFEFSYPISLSLFCSK